MSKNAIALLSSFQPLQGLFSTRILRFQASPTCPPHDSLLSWVKQIFLFENENANTTTNWSLTSAVQWKLVLGQFVEGPLVVLTTSLVMDCLYVQTTKNKKERKHKQHLLKEVQERTHPFWSRLNIGFLTVHSVVITLLSCASHHLAIIRTHYYVSRSPPSETFSQICFEPSLSSSLFTKSVILHIGTGVLDLWICNIFGHCASRLLCRSSKSTSTTKDECSCHFGDTTKKRSKMQRQVRELHSVFLVNVGRILSSFATRLVLFPLYTMRARLESQLFYGPVPYHGPLDCFWTIWKQEGITGFYRGCSYYILSLGMQGVYMGLIYALARGAIANELWEDSEDNEEPYHA